MDINITTPTVLFSAISLLMLAYTNRFLALSSLVRQFHGVYTQQPDHKIFSQIQNFRKRLQLIRNMQLCGVLSFIFCVACMFLVFAKQTLAAEIVFGFSLLLLMFSLILSLIEIYISVDALNVELSSMEQQK